MLDALNLGPSDKLLEIGTGSGTQTAMFAKTGTEVHSIELQMWLSEVTDLGCTNVYLHQGDGQMGIPGEAPFSAIVATCGVEQVPEAWKAQLADNGRLIAPVGDVASQRLTLFVKERGELRPERIVAYVRFQMLKEPPKPRPLKYAVDSTAS